MEMFVLIFNKLILDLKNKRVKKSLLYEILYGINEILQ